MKKINSISIRKIRIISGKWKNKKLPVLPFPELRPTTNFIREMLFNWLAPLIKNSLCMDCFSGSGALGFEALSRYASNVTFLEKNKNIANQIQKNLSELKVKNADLININTLTYLAQNTKSKKYNIVFIDPPFYKGFLIKETLKFLEKNNWLLNHAFIYIERKKVKRIFFSTPKNWILYREKATKKVICQLFYRK